MGYVGKSVGYVGKSVGYAAITHTFQPMKSIRSDVPWYKYIIIYIYILEKWFPFQGERAHSLLFFLLYMFNRKEEEEGETEQQQQFTKGCNILHRLQVYHLTLTYIIHNKYTSTLYLYTYMHIPIMIALIIMPFIDRINVRYKLLGTYMKEVDKNS